MPKKSRFVNNSPFKKVLQKKGFIVKKKDEIEKPATHFLMDGGRAHIPKNDQASFFALYADAIANGDRLYVVELRTKIFKFLVDADIFLPTSEDHSWDPKSLDEYIGCIQGVLREFYPQKSDAEIKPIVCTREPVVTPKGLKIGMHPIWPGILVNSDIALNLREAIVQRMSDLSAQRMGGTRLSTRGYTSEMA
jgi:prim-pol family protein involved in RNA processing and repair